jgi:phage shock protein PspC (stress-responsive transcriptional regulator)
MKKVVNVGIGGVSFTIDEDAYNKLDKYLEKFRQRTKMGTQTIDVMEDLEQRIAELFSLELKTKQSVVNMAIVDKVIAQLGMPDGEAMDDFDIPNNSYDYLKSSKKLYRDPDNKQIAGVCSGLGYYFNIDITLLRIIFFVALFIGGTSFWIYLAIWIIAPEAVTPAQKCEMRGLPVTAENMKKFSMFK